MQLVRNEPFGDRRIPIDGTRYENCTFSGTKLIYYGDEPVEFSDCTFDSCTWVFEGAAFRTLQFLSVLNSGLGDDGQTLVNGIVEDVRQGLPGEKLLVATAA